MFCFNIKSDISYFVKFPKNTLKHQIRTTYQSGLIESFKWFWSNLLIGQIWIKTMINLQIIISITSYEYYKVS